MTDGYYTIEKPTFIEADDGCISFAWCEKTNDGRFIIQFGVESQWFYLDKDGKFHDVHEGDGSLKNVVDGIKKHCPGLLTFHEYVK